MVCLPKDPNKEEDDPNNTRPIFLQPIPLKTVDRIINNRVQKLIEIAKILEPEQGGFIAKRGTGEQSFALRQLACRLCAEKKAFLIAFIDCKSAFDRVMRQFMLLNYTKKVFGVKFGALLGICTRAPVFRSVGTSWTSYAECARGVSALLRASFCGSMTLSKS